MPKLACLLLMHRWDKVMYAGADSPNGFFLRCRRCGKEREAPGSAGGATKSLGV